MRSSRATTVLRVSYWGGAVLDGVMVVPMLVPRVAAAMFGIEHFDPGRDYRYAMMVGASLMLGWTILLIWADRKPIERKGVAIITAVPVILGLAGAGAFAVASGLIKVDKMVPTWGLQGILCTLFLWGYFTTGSEKSPKNRS